MLTFLSGARRQIFVVFAAFLMVEKFGYSASQVTLLFLINYIFNWFFAERIGRLISRIGERNALTCEYVGLIFVFVAYGLVENATLAAALYVLDHMFFAMAIAISTYFQKIADPKDMASSAGVSFTISHIAAIVIPAALGLVWISSPSLVFYCGAAFCADVVGGVAVYSRDPQPGNETTRSQPGVARPQRRYSGVGSLGCARGSTRSGGSAYVPAHNFCNSVLSGGVLKRSAV